MSETQQYETQRSAPTTAPIGLAYNFEGGSYSTEPQPRDERPQEESNLLDLDSIN